VSVTVPPVATIKGFAITYIENALSTIPSAVAARTVKG
jgi:hypothetical protein